MVIVDLLYITEGVPTRDPVRGDGSSLIPYEVIRHMASGIDITLLTFGESQEVPSCIRRRCHRVEVLPLSRPRLAVALANLSPLSSGALQRATRGAVRSARALSSRADVTLVHGAHAAFLAHSVCGPVVLQVVDPWSLRAEMEADLSVGYRRAHRRVMSRLALAGERHLPARTRLLTVGERDAHMWSQRIGRPVGSVPNGVDEDPRPDESSGDRPPTVCFVGSLNYGPNIESAHVLVREIAPEIWASAPETRILLAGRQPDPSILALATDRVEVLANVPSVWDVFARSDVAVFADRHGVGIRNSVLEALAAGLPVVATPAAAREQQAQPLLYVGDSIPALVRLTREVLKTPRALNRRRQAVQTRAWSQVALKYQQELVQAMSDQAGT